VRVPVGLRTLAYGTVFLAALLGALPWLADRAARSALPWRLDLGPWRWAGWALLGLALLAYLAVAALLVRRGKGPYVEFDPPKELVTSGPYARSRNPIVLLVLAMLLGLGVALSSVGVLLLFALALPLAWAQVRLVEEPRLRRRFGAAYDDYCRRVPRWL
jgi:protein-S-isoprenylcysteine O-methyltransferase Ste14